MSSYCLELADGQGWHILAGNEASQWVTKLAAIMELRSCKPNGYPKLLIIRRTEELDISTKAHRAYPNMKNSLSLHEYSLHEAGSLRFWYSDNRPDVICEIGEEENRDKEIIKMWNLLLPISQKTQDNGGLPLHGALVEKQGRGIILAASGGIGKSTCCHRIPSPWRSLCDNETLIVKGKRGEYVAHPLPTWSEHLSQESERTWSVEQHLPLQAIFFLEQSDTDEVLPLGQGKAAIRIIQLAHEVSWLNFYDLNQEEKRVIHKRLFRNASQLTMTVPSFILRATLTGSFWEKMEKVLF